MDRNNSNEMESDDSESERCVAFFVPASSSAFVVEILECAFSGDKNLVRVAAGALHEIPRNIGVPLSAVRDKTCLPEFTEEKYTPKPPPKPFEFPKKYLVSAPRLRLQRWKRFKMACKRQKQKLQWTRPEYDNHCCPYKLSAKMEKKYGKAVPQSDGTASAPRLMVQYPGLPYMAPISQKFKDLGRPRGIVDFTYASIFTADAVQEFPMVKTEPVDSDPEESH